MTAAKTRDASPEPVAEIDILQLIAKATDPSIVRELRELRREMSEEIDKRLFFAAMSRVQAAISQVATDAANPQTSSKYATFAALDRAIRPHYTAEGFSVQFDDEPRGADQLWVECTVSRGGWQTKHHHTVAVSTHGIKGTQMMTPTHAGASALSYGKRYTYGMAFNVAIERDDDGNRAGTRTLSNSQIDELMEIAKGANTIQFCQQASEHLGYKVENLSMVLQSDMGKVTTWLRAWLKRKEPAA